MRLPPTSDYAIEATSEVAQLRDGTTNNRLHQRIGYRSQHDLGYWERRRGWDSSLATIVASQCGWN